MKLYTVRDGEIRQATRNDIEEAYKELQQEAEAPKLVSIKLYSEGLCIGVLSSLEPYRAGFRVSRVACTQELWLGDSYAITVGDEPPVRVTLMEREAGFALRDTYLYDYAYFEEE